MTAPRHDIDGCLAAQDELEHALDGLTDEVARRASRLPGWTVGHVLSHIARNAESVAHRLEGAARGEVHDQYAGGYEGRAAGIEAGAGRSAQALVADVVTTNRAVAIAFSAMPDDAWGNPTRSVDGEEPPAQRLAFGRWREVEVHHVDLGLGYTPARWPDELVDRLLPDVLSTLPGRTDRRGLLAWTLGRGGAPPLDAWG